MNKKSLNDQSRSRIQRNHFQYIIVLLLLVLISVLLYLLDTTILKPFLMVTISLLILCLVWYDFRCRRNLFELCNTLHILQTLFDTSFHNETVKDALKEIGSSIDADFVYFLFGKNDGSSKRYEYRSNNHKKMSLTFEELLSLFGAVGQHGKDGKVSWTKKSSRNLDKAAAEIMSKHEIYNAECVKVKASERNTSGILLAINVRKSFPKCYFECIANLLLTSVIRFCHIEKLENMSKLDSLTGLLNRNSYQTVVADYKKAFVKKLACIYIDLNGLHNINNRFGHDKGDQMLCCTANSLVNNFGSNDVFRIGGDEFVVLYPYESKADTERQLRRMRQELLDCGCNVSIGIEWCDNSADIDVAIKRAEAKMFQEKNEYYRTEKRI